MNEFRNWYIRNQDAISWFIIGMMVSSAIDNVVRGNYIVAGISAGLAYLNYKLSKIRLQY